MPFSGGGRAGVLVVIATLEIGGAEKQAVMLANLMVDRHRVVVVILHGARVNAKLQRTIREEVRLVPLQGGVMARFIGLARTLIEERPRALFSFLTGANLLGAVAGRLCGVPRIYPSIRSAYLPPRKALVERFVIKPLATRVIFNSERALRAIFGSGDAKCIVIYNCVRKPMRRRPGLGISGTPVLVTVARFTREKDIDTALDAISFLRDSGLVVGYRIVGYGALEQEIRDRVSKLHLSDRVEVVVDPDNVGELVAGSDLALSTSLVEGLSNSLLEAAAAGLPIVATDVGDTCAVVVNEVNGLLVEPGNVPQIAGAIRRICEDGGLYERFSRASSGMAEGKFSMERFAAEYSALI